MNDKTVSTVIIPEATGASIRKLAKTAPVRCPRRVTRLTSAPKAPAFSRIPEKQICNQIKTQFTFSALWGSNGKAMRNTQKTYNATQLQYPLWRNSLVES